DDMRERPGRLHRHLIRADTKRGLRIGLRNDHRKAEGQNEGCRFSHQPVFPFCSQSISRRVANIFDMSVPVGSLKKASVSVAWFWASASSGSGRTTLDLQPAGRPFMTRSLSFM